MTLAPCDRCKTPLDISGESYHNNEMTAGYYQVDGPLTPFSWRELSEAQPHEKRLCDNCMWVCPKYIAIYGSFGSVKQ